MGLNGLLGLSAEALAAQAFALDVTGQNISNVNTPGYVRRVAVLEARPSGPSSNGGVTAKGIERAYDQFIGGRYFTATGLASSSTTRDQALANIEASFVDSGNGIGTALGQLFSSFSALAANPSDSTARAAVLSAADALSLRFRSAAESITTARRDMLSQAQGTASEINDELSQIARLNDQIATAQNMGHDAADLSDKRQKLLEDLSQRIDVQTFTDGSGKLVVRGGGATLVEGGVAASLSVTTATDGSMKVLVSRGDSTAVDISTSLTGGRLAGLQSARDTDAVAIAKKLDQLAWDVGSAVNDQHRAGVGLDGTDGRALFALGAGPSGAASTIALDASMVGHPERLAAAASTTTGPGDSDNAVALAQLGTSSLGAGARTPSEAWSDVVGDVGLRRANARDEAALRSDMRDQAKALQDSQSGVSLDEEMVNLTKYQRAYQAATKLLSTADELLRGLMQELKP